MRNKRTQKPLLVKKERPAPNGRDTRDQTIITERKRAEEALRESEDRYQDLVEHSHDMIYTHDLDGRVLFANQTSSLLLGLAPSEVVGKRLTEFLAPKVRDQFDAYLAEISKNGIARGLMLVQTSIGEERVCEYYNTLRTDVAGGPIVRCIAHDITERRRAEEPLRRREMDLADFFENAAMGLHWVGPDGVILRINQAELDLLGYTRDECIGHHIAEFHADRNVIEDILERLQAGEVLRDYEARLRCKDGSIKYVLINSSVYWEDGKFIHTRCFTRDVTERKLADEALRQAEEKYRSIFENASEGIFQTTPDGRIITANPALARMHGFDSPEELVRERTDIASQHYVDPERRDEFKRLLEEHGSVRGFEYQGYRKDGSRMWLSDSVRAVRDESGAVLYYEGIAEDITERKLAEVALQESEERFRQLSEAAFEAIILHDNGIVLEVNQSFCRMYGYEREEIIGRSVLDLALPEFRDQLRQIARSGYVGPYESPALRKDGTVFNAEVCGKPIQYQGRIARVAAIRDITEKKRNERRRAAQYNVTRVLAESATLAEATPQLLRVICESLRWKMGEFWRVCDGTNLLRCVETWHVPALEATSFIEASRQTELAPGVGLPGRVWQSGRPAWISDVTTDPGFARAAIAGGLGLRGAVAVPILLEDHTLGVMLFLSRRAPEVDEDLLKMLSAIGSQIGQFTERKRAEEAQRRSEQRFAAFMNNTSAQTWIKDDDFRYVYANEPLARLFGRSLNDIIGKNDFELLPPETAQQFRANDEAARASEKVLETEEKIHSNGELRLSRVYKFPLRDADGRIYVGGMAIDITERKQAEEALRESEGRYRELFEQASDMIYTTDESGIWLALNPAALLLLKYAEEELLGQSQFDLIRPDYRKPFKEFYRQQYLRRIPNTFYSFPVIAKDGIEIWIEQNGTLLFDNDRVAGFHFVARNITERKRAEEALRQTEQQYESLVHSIDGIVWEVDPRTFTFIFVSKQADRLLGYPRAQWLNEPNFWADHIHPDDREWAVDFCLRATGRKEDHRFEYRMIAADGRVVWLKDLVTVSIMDDGSVRLRGVMVDITERKRAEEALRESEERYRELFDNARDAIYVHDLNGKYTSINPAAEKLLDYSRDEILGRHFSDFVASNYLKTTRAHLGEKLADRHKTTYEVEVIARDGRRIPVEVRSALIYEHGVPVAVQGTARDITDRKLVEEATRTYSRRLIEAQEAERRLIARELHDQVGQMLTALKLNLHAIQSARDGNEARRLIEDNLKMLDEALEQVRDLSVDLRPLLLDDLGLVTALRWYVDRQAQRTGVVAEFTSDSLDSDLRFSAELETACFRIAQEALTNVARHADAKLVTVRLSRDEQHLHLSIEDDGVGFDIESLRGHAVGATLGLRGMEERAKAQGGRIRIESPKNKGTRVFVDLPITIPNEAKPSTQRK